MADEYANIERRIERIDETLDALIASNAKINALMERLVNEVIPKINSIESAQASHSERIVKLELSAGFVRWFGVVASTSLISVWIKVFFG